MPSAAIDGAEAPFQSLLEGTWSNLTLPNASSDEGSKTQPLSYNVMPLPQQNSYILKNFTLYEDVTFNSATPNDDQRAAPPPTTAPNRGSNSLQLPTALYYQQQVFFGDGPDANTVVHTENGAWLYITRGPKLVGPYDAPMVAEPNTQPAGLMVGKQMSIPHGNSILAMGPIQGPTTGTPIIPDTTGIPTDPAINTSLYGQKLDSLDNYQNPIPVWTRNPNLPVQQGVALICPTHYYLWQVNTDAVTQGTMNIPFEESKAWVAGYLAQYWLMSNDGGSNYNYLAYTQNISLELSINGQQHSFPHVTTNVLTRNTAV